MIDMFDDCTTESLLIYYDIYTRKNRRNKLPLTEYDNEVIRVLCNRLSFWALVKHGIFP